MRSKKTQKPNKGLTCMQWHQTASAVRIVREIICLVCILSTSAAVLHHAAATSEAVQNDASTCEPQRNEVVLVGGILFWTYIQVAGNPSAMLPPPRDSCVWLCFQAMYALVIYRFALNLTEKITQRRCRSTPCNWTGNYSQKASAPSAAPWKACNFTAGSACHD